MKCGDQEHRCVIKSVQSAQLRDTMSTGSLCRPDVRVLRNTAQTRTSTVQSSQEWRHRGSRSIATLQCEVWQQLLNDARGVCRAATFCSVTQEMHMHTAIHTQRHVYARCRAASSVLVSAWRHRGLALAAKYIASRVSCPSAVPKMCMWNAQGSDQRGGAEARRIHPQWAFLYSASPACQTRAQQAKTLLLTSHTSVAVRPARMVRKTMIQGPEGQVRFRATQAYLGRLYMYGPLSSSDSNQ
jgi:hypothetical protein